MSESENGRGTTVAEAVAAYLKDTEPPQREPKTYAAYKYGVRRATEGRRK